jgi:predicted phage tail protein
VSGKTYTVKVLARNNAGFSSQFSATQSIVIPTTGDIPTTPATVTASSDMAAITLKWVNGTERDLKSIEIYWSTASGGTFSQLGTIDGLPAANQEYNLVWDASNFTLGTVYYFKLKSVNTSGNKSAFSSEVTASFNFVETNNVESAAISSIYSSVMATSFASRSIIANAIDYNSAGNILNGNLIAEVTLGTIGSDITGFLIQANAYVSKRSMPTTSYMYAIVLEKPQGQAYWTTATGSGNYATFLGTGDATGQTSQQGIQGCWSISFLDSSSNFLNTTGSKYGLFLYATPESADNMYVFAGTGITVTELKR